MKAVVFDTETTGLIRNRTLKLDQQPEVIEFYACAVNLKTGRISKELDFLIKPLKPLSDKPAPGEKKTITQMNGISNEMLKGKPTFKEVHAKIFSMLQGAPVVIAHNASFDKEMINIEAQRLGIELAWPRVICSIEQTLHLKGHRLSLTNLHLELFGEPFDGAHRAKVDVAALVRCCRELHKRDII